MSGYISVKNWQEFQHYKDRTPPWIKLHRDLLRDYEFSRLQDASKAHLMCIWLLASQLDNRIPNDPDWISRQIGAHDPVDLNPLIKAGFLVCSNPLAPCKQSAMLETETETEEEKPLSRPARQDTRFEDWWKIYPRREAKKKAKEIWKRRKLDTKADALIADVENRLTSDQKWLEGFIPMPTTYLNGDRWEDEMRTAPSASVPLPTDNRSLWSIRSKLGLDYEYDDLKDCHAEIRRVLREKPELRSVVEA